VGCVQRIIRTHAPAAVILIRLMVGGVFASEGIQKYLFPDDVGAGRFVKIGIPQPQIMAPIVGAFVTVCGTRVILGLLTRLAAIPLTVIISVAIYATKVPFLRDDGFWKMAHEGRTDYCMFLGGLFLLIVGAGVWSIDAALCKSETRNPVTV
jgi:putative oxidoreductase